MQKYLSGAPVSAKMTVVMQLRKMTAWLPSLLWAGLIFWLSSRSKLPQVGPEFPNKDKVAHFVFYGILGLLVFLALRRAHNLPLPKAALLAILVASAYGATDELHQWFVPQRSCDVWDWTTDTLGAGIAAAAFYAHESRRSTKTNR